MINSDVLKPGDFALGAWTLTYPDEHLVLLVVRRGGRWLLFARSLFLDTGEVASHRVGLRGAASSEEIFTQMGILCRCAGGNVSTLYIGSDDPAKIHSTLEELESSAPTINSLN